METFIKLSSIELSKQIKAATNRVIYAAPGIEMEVSATIINCIKLLGREKITLIVDNDPETFRLGYGNIEAVENLINSGITVRMAPGIRIGILITDNNTSLFSPIPLLIEDQFNRSYINGINVSIDQGLALLQSISPDLIIKEGKKILKDKLDSIKQKPEIGTQDFNKSDLKAAKKDLEERPPKQFDFERRVRVYNSHVQFV